MKKYFVVKTECMMKILDCFSSSDDYQLFSEQLTDMMDEVKFAGLVAERNDEDENLYAMMTVKQLFLFALFCRQNIELIHELVNSVDFYEVSKEEKDKLDVNDPEANLDRTE